MKTRFREVIELLAISFIASGAIEFFFIDVYLRTGPVEISTTFITILAVFIIIFAMIIVVRRLFFGKMLFSEGNDELQDSMSK